MSAYLIAMAQFWKDEYWTGTPWAFVPIGPVSYSGDLIPVSVMPLQIVLI